MKKRKGAPGRAVAERPVVAGDGQDHVPDHPRPPVQPGELVLALRTKQVSVITRTWHSEARREVRVIRLSPAAAAPGGP